MNNKLIHLPFFTKEECTKIINYCHLKEDEFKNKKLKKPNSFGGLTTTEFYAQYNFFIDNPIYIERLKNIIEKNFYYLNYPLIVQSWVNIYRKNEGIDWHIHFSPSSNCRAITSNIFIGGNENIGITYAFHDDNLPKYKFINIKNKLGHIQFVKCDVPHMVRKNNTNENRYTIGMTISEYDPITIKYYTQNYEKCKDMVLIIPQKKILKSTKKENLIYF